MTAAPATLERASAKEQSKSAAQTDRERQSEIEKLERQFVNRDAIRAWAKLQPIPLVFDRNGKRMIGFDVDNALFERFTDEMVAAMQDKAGAEYEGKVRMGKVPDGTTVFVLT